jgi:hypothetical protein
MEAGRHPSGRMASADRHVLITPLNPLSRGAACRTQTLRRKRTQSTFHRRPVIYHDSTVPSSPIPHSGAPAEEENTAGRPQTPPASVPASEHGVPIRPPGLEAPCMPSVDFSTSDAGSEAEPDLNWRLGLPVGVPRPAPVDRPAALPPARRRRPEHLDLRHHAVSQFGPELL